MGYVVQRDAASTTKKIQRRIARRREKKSLGVVDCSRGVRPEETRIRVLHDIVLIFERRKTPVQVGSERGLKRLHLLGEPPGLIKGVRLMGRRQTHANRNNATLPSGRWQVASGKRKAQMRSSNLATRRPLRAGQKGILLFVILRRETGAMPVDSLMNTLALEVARAFQRVKTARIFVPLPRAGKRVPRVVHQKKKRSEKSSRGFACGHAAGSFAGVQDDNPNEFICTTTRCASVDSCLRMIDRFGRALRSLTRLGSGWRTDSRVGDDPSVAAHRPRANGLRNRTSPTA